LHQALVLVASGLGKSKLGVKQRSLAIEGGQLVEQVEFGSASFELLTFGSRVQRLTESKSAWLAIDAAGGAHSSEWGE
jgi:hypothetical protein